MPATKEKDMVTIRRQKNEPKTTSINCPACSMEFDPGKDEFEVERAHLTSILHNGNFVEVKDKGGNKTTSSSGSKS